MTLDIRKRIFIIAGGVFLLLLLLVLFLVFRSKAPTPVTPNPPVTNGEEEAQAPLIIVDLPPAPPPSSPEERDRLYAVQLSKIFVERYMSHSNQNENTHISDVNVLVSPQMETYLQTQKEQFSRDYKGLSTKVIASSLLSYESEKATVAISVQQFIEEKGKVGFTEYKNGRVTLLKSEAGWRVTGLFWEDENTAVSTTSTTP